MRAIDAVQIGLTIFSIAVSMFLGLQGWRVDSYAFWMSSAWILWALALVSIILRIVLRKRAGSVIVTLLVAWLLLPVGGWFLSRQREAYLADKYIIAVADLYGNDPAVNQMSERLLNQLRRTLGDYEDVSIVHLDEQITEQEGSEVARERGAAVQADVVVWGRYSSSADSLNAWLYVENLSVIPDLSVVREDKYSFSGESTGQDLHKRVDEMTRSLGRLLHIVAGAASYGAGDFSTCVSQMSDALSFGPGAIDPRWIGEVLYTRARANLRQGAPEAALADLQVLIDNQAVESSNLLNLTALALMGMGDHGGAIETLETALGIDSTNVDAMHNMAVCWLAVGDGEAALNWFEQAFYLSGAIKDQLGSAAAYAQQGQVDYAIALLDGLIEEGVDDARVYSLLGVLYLTTSQFTKAADSYRKSIGRDREALDAQLGLARALVLSGSEEPASDQLDRLHRIAPESSEVHCIEAMLYRGQGSNVKALESATSACAADPRDSEAHNLLGAALVDLGCWSEAVGAFNAAIELAEYPFEAMMNRSVALLNLGTPQHLEAAEVDLLQVIEFLESPGPLWTGKHGYSDSDRASVGSIALRFRFTTTPRGLSAGRAYYLLGCVRGKMGRYQEALENFSEAERLVTASEVGAMSEVLMQKGITLLSLERTEEAASALARARAIEPDDGNILYWRAVAYASTGGAEMLQSAKELYGLAIPLAAAGDLANVHAEFAVCLAVLGESDEARVHAEEAIELAPRSPSIRGKAARAFMHMGRLNTAIYHSNVLLVLLSEQPYEALLLRAELQHRGGNIGAALEDLKMALNYAATDESRDMVEELISALEGSPESGDLWPDDEP